MLEHLRRHGSVKRWDITMKKKDGSLAPFELSIGLLRDSEGGVLGSVCVARDVSEIKKMLIELKASYDRLSREITIRERAEVDVERLSRENQLILDAAGEGIVGLDRLGRVIFINPAGAAIVGYEIEEMVGKDLHSMIHHSKPDGSAYPMGECPMFQSLNVGVARRERDEVFWKKNGASFPVAYSSTPILEKDEILGAVITFRDITFRRRALEELSRYRDRLEELVRERTTELARANEQLTREIEERKCAEEALLESSRKLKLFAYSVAHDLKSPSVGIHGLTQLLCNQYSQTLDERGRVYCSQILRTSEHIASLVDQVNTYISTKETPLRIEPINFKDIMRMIKDEFSPRFTVREIDFSEPAFEIDFKADRLSIIRVFRNLVDNALKYGGEHLSRIWIEHEETDDFHIFSVGNDGTKVKEVDPEKMFGAFQRDASSRGIEGSGLGLTIVKEIAERHGGKVWTEPASPNGITFNLSVTKNI
jgi:PAS domain S-box-containing protein